jgi:ketosteroid isomerase-like protein
VGGLPRVDLVRLAYERFNKQDVDGVLELLDDDVEWPDLVHTSVLKGKEAVRQYWRRQFEIATPTVLVGEVMEVGEAVIAVAYQQLYDLHGRLLGPPNVVVHRFRFRGGLVSKMELTNLDEIPDDVRRLFRDE